MPARPDVTPQPTGPGAAFPAEFQMQAPAPAAADPQEALMQRIQAFNDAANQLQTQKTMNDQTIEANKTETIVQAFQVLKDLGINPADPKSISNYLVKLAEQEPDMAELMKKALYGIFGGGPQGADAAAPQPDMSQMNAPQPESEPMF